MIPIYTAAKLAEHQVGQHGRDYSKSDDGYSDMEVAATEGWRPVAGWGADGWDLGDWPYVVVSVREITPENGPFGSVYEMRQTCEGDTTVYHFDTLDERNAAIDYLFVWYAIGKEILDFDRVVWDSELGDYPARVALDNGTLDVPDEYRGPYSSRRETLMD